jgi:DNA-binding CsgD family transcriptional regulator
MPRDHPAHHDNLLHESMTFAQGYLGASVAVFFWVAPQCNSMLVQHSVGVPSAMLDEYEKEMHRLDPMSTDQMVESRRRVGLLDDGYATPLGTGMDRYKGFLSSFGVTDTLDLMFWSQDRPFGGMGLLKTANDPKFMPPLDRLREFQAFLEVSLGQHSYVREIHADTLLAQRGLSHRERQVTRLVAGGASNRDIAQEMGITVGTVKTYLARIFEKLNVASRTELAMVATKR